MLAEAVPAFLGRNIGADVAELVRPFEGLSMEATQAALTRHHEAVWASLGRIWGSAASARGGVCADAAVFLRQFLSVAAFVAHDLTSGPDIAKAMDASGYHRKEVTQRWAMDFILGVQLEQCCSQLLLEIHQFAHLMLKVTHFCGLLF
jgi:hypothetical protein